MFRGREGIRKIAKASHISAPKPIVTMTRYNNKAPITCSTSDIFRPLLHLLARGAIEQSFTCYNTLISASPFECAPLRLAGRTFERNFMDDELVKELKYAGFPLRHNECDSVECRCDIEIIDGGWIVPTLSELIEACGKPFAMDTEYPEVNWIAWKPSTKTDKRMLNGKGPTPTEAVARLWLALHANGDASA
jgi:hypothetical protein